MKKNRKIFKKLLFTALFTTTIISHFSTVSAYNGSYDLENEEYINYIEENCQKKFKYEEAVITIIGEQYKHIYNDLLWTEENDNVYTACTLEYVGEQENIRAFASGCIYWSTLTVKSDDFYNTYGKDDIISFLDEKNLNQKITNIETRCYGTQKEYNEVIISYQNDVDYEYLIDVIVSLNEKYGLKPLVKQAVSTISFTDEKNPTIAGDLDLNNEQGIADIVALTKYNTSAELFPITDATALANADINRDGTIDAIDTSLLIEIMLGTFESAV